MLGNKIKRFIGLTRIYLNRRLLQVQDSDRFFFIIGSGRCGSTLLRVILERHSDITIIPEINAALPSACDLCLEKQNQSKKSLFDDFLLIYSKQRAWDSSLFGRRQLKDIYLQNKNPNGFPSFLESLYKVYKIKMKPQANLLGDKNPYLTFFIPHLKVIFPKARFIHLIRDGRDVASSWHLTDTLKVDLEMAAHRWNWALKEVERFRPLINDRLLEIKYEDLVRMPNKVINDICSFLEVPYTDDLLDNKHNYSSKEVMKDHHKSSIQNINKESVGKWEQNLTEEQVNKIYPILNKRLKKYKYV